MFLNEYFLNAYFVSEYFVICYLYLFFYFYIVIRIQFDGDMTIMLKISGNLEVFVKITIKGMHITVFTSHFCRQSTNYHYDKSLIHESSMSVKYSFFLTR